MVKVVHKSEKLNKPWFATSIGNACYEKEQALYKIYEKSNFR